MKKVPSHISGVKATLFWVILFLQPILVHGAAVTKTFDTLSDEGMDTAPYPGLWRDVHGVTYGRHDNSVLDAMDVYTAAWHSDSGYIAIYRSFLTFDTSSIPDDAVVTSIRLQVTPKLIFNELGDLYSYMDVLPSYQAEDVATYDDIEQCGNAVTNPVKFTDGVDMHNFQQDVPFKFDLNVLAFDWISKTGPTALCLREGHDTSNTEVINNLRYWISSGLILYSSEHSTPEYRPQLEVTYTVGGVEPVDNYPLYTQIESVYPSIDETSDWEDDTFAYGSQEWCGDTIGGCGCAITSGVMAGRNADITTDIVGNDVNPKNINEYLRSVGGYTSDGSVYWLAMQAYLGELTNDGRLASRFQYVGKYEGAAAMLAVDQYLENEGEYAVLAFKNSLGHFIWLPAKTGDSYVVRDPFWYLTQTANDTTGADIKDYNDSFDSVRVFQISEEPVVASGSGVEAYLKGTAELVYKDATGSAVGYTSGGTVVNLPNSSYGNAEVIGLNGTPSPNAGGKHLLVSDSSNEFTIEVIGTGTGGFEMEFFTISETGEVTTYTFSGQTIPGVTSTFTFNLETGEVKEEPISYEQFLNILSLQLDGYTDQQKAFFMKWANKMYSDMEEKTVSQALQSISVYGKLLVAKKVASPVLTSVLDLLTEGVKKR